MQRKNLITRMIPTTKGPLQVALLILGLSLSLPQVVHANGPYATKWSHTTPIYEGGVPEKIQLLRTQCTSGPEPDDSVVWAINMEMGVFRNHWNGDWGTWTGYVVNGANMFGLDAIRVGNVEYVLTAGMGGVNYSYGSPPPQNNWLPPNTMPDHWSNKLTQDVAFYCSTPDDLYANPPNSKYFMSLSDTVWNDPIQHTDTLAKPGLYRWDNGAQPQYTRVDETGPLRYQTAEQFNRFYRDLRSPNVLYARRNAHSNAQGQITVPGMLMRFSGSYDNQTLPSFYEVKIVNSSLGALQEINAFNQWWDYNLADPVYSYALVYWQPSGATAPHYSVFVSTNLATDHPTFTRSCDVADSLAAPNHAQAWLDTWISSTHHTQPLTAGLPPLPSHLSHK